MNEKPRQPDESTVLHLHQFAPGAKPAANEEPSATVMVKLAAEQVVQKHGAPVSPREGGALPGKEMLGAVSYCYAKGVYTSEEIERKMMRDPVLRESVQGNVPDAKAIRRFRVLNREAIQQTLEKAFGFLRKKEKAAALKPLPGQPTPAAPALQEPGETTVVFARHKAEERVQEAAFIDNMSKD